MNLVSKINEFQSTISAFLRGADNTKLIVLGHQKSGTTAIASLIAQSCKMSFANDPVYFTDKNSTTLIEKLLNHPIDFKKHVSHNKASFFKEVVKDPDFTFSYSTIKEIYPNSQLIFVARNPFDIIRSIFNRLGIDGEIDRCAVTENELKNPTKQWLLILNGDGKDNLTIVQRLAKRIDESTQTYLDNQSALYLIKYEDFKLSKQGSVENSVKNLGFSVKYDISNDVNKQYQPKGNADVTYESFFSPRNLEIISTECQRTILTFSY